MYCCQHSRQYYCLVLVVVICKGQLCHQPCIRSFGICVRQFSHYEMGRCRSNVARAAKLPTVQILCVINTICIVCVAHIVLHCLSEPHIYHWYHQQWRSRLNIHVHILHPLCNFMKFSTNVPRTSSRSYQITWQLYNIFWFLQVVCCSWRYLSGNMYRTAISTQVHRCTCEKNRAM